MTRCRPHQLSIPTPRKSCRRRLTKPRRGGRPLRLLTDCRRSKTLTECKPDSRCHFVIIQSDQIPTVTLSKKAVSANRARMISCSVNVETTMNLSNCKHSANEIRRFRYVTIILKSHFTTTTTRMAVILGTPCSLRVNDVFVIYISNTYIVIYRPM